MSVVSEEWNKLTSEAKIPYFQLAAKDKERFIQENRAFKEACITSNISKENGSKKTEKDSPFEHYSIFDMESVGLVPFEAYKKVKSKTLK